jgi:MGT family glycosyltransferase
VSHIALFTMPLHGHVNPVLGPVRELVRRGHRVTFPTTGEFADAVAATGAGAPPYTGVIGPSRDLTVKAPGDLTAAEFHESILRLTEEGLAPLEVALDRLDGDRPDVVLHDFTAFHTGRLLAAAWGLPAVRLCTTLVHNAAHNPYLRFLAQYPPIDPEHPDLRRERELTEAAHRRVGLEPRDPAAFREDGSTVAGNVVFVPPALQPGREHFDGRWHFVGSGVDGRPLDPDAAVPAFPPGVDGPLVLVSFGSFGYASQRELFTGCVRELAGEPVRVVLVVGHRVDPADLEPLPPNVVVRRSVPQLELLAHVDVLVGHAGMGSVVEAVATATPMVLLPQLTEQDLVAEQVARLGLGRVLPRGEAGADRVRAAVRELLADPAVPAALAGARDGLRAAGGSARAADVVEAVLQGSAHPLATAPAG